MQNEKLVSKATACTPLLRPKLKQDNVPPDLWCKGKSEYTSAFFLTPFSSIGFRLLSMA